MNIYRVPLRAGPQQLAITLSGVVYNLRLRYNERTELWVLDIADADGKSMIRNVPMVTGCNLLEQYHHLGFQGVLAAVNSTIDTDTPPAFGQLEGALLYVTGVPV